MFHDWEDWWCLLQGFRTGYIYRYPLVKGEPPRPRNDVEVPPAVSSLGYLLEEEELYKHGWVGLCMLHAIMFNWYWYVNVIEWKENYCPAFTLWSCLPIWIAFSVVWWWSYKDVNSQSPLLCLNRYVNLRKILRNWLRLPAHSKNVDHFGVLGIEVTNVSIQSEHMLHELSFCVRTIVCTIPQFPFT
jgi:hypothetical protein